MKHLDFEFRMGLHGEVYQLNLSLGAVPDPDLTSEMIDLCIDRAAQALKHTVRQITDKSGLREESKET